ncbi:hypothetical protein WN944_024674 [Citrus x changshan-huyou]|uniref:Uncharacterized protein n=1 Tax=Citrus x changshan-huyou TaxID=2935761 RepID=A0AAP0QFY5_9ROSI
MKEDTKISNYGKFDSQLLAAFTSSLYIAGLIAFLFASKVTRAFGRKASILACKRWKKNLATKELKQIWNSAVAVVVAVATIAVAILEQRQRKFRAGYLQNCDMMFPNLTYARPRLLFTLIFSYKRSTHHKE